MRPLQQDMALNEANQFPLCSFDRCPQGFLKEKQNEERTKAEGTLGLYCSSI